MGMRSPLLRIRAAEDVTLRFAFPDDAQALARLAALDSSGSPTPQVLLAEVDGELRAALSLFDGTVVADPFQPAVALIELLNARAQQLSEAGAVRRRRRASLGRARLGLARPRPDGWTR
ncbi:MAG: hypothetical protein DLM64_10125 [Solirubrobacterales bacterium]|nr:MAG: hypothetical protein DLM64_10125 [Solirubrobacterales bacterium]